MHLEYEYVMHHSLKGLPFHQSRLGRTLSIFLDAVKPVKIMKSYVLVTPKLEHVHDHLEQSENSKSDNEAGYVIVWCWLKILSIKYLLPTLYFGASHGQWKHYSQIIEKLEVIEANTVDPDSTTNMEAPVPVFQCLGMGDHNNQ